MSVERKKIIQVRCTEAEMAMAQQLADDDGVSVSTCVRMLIVRAHRRKLGGKAALEAATTGRPNAEMKKPAHRIRPRHAGE